MVKVLSRIREQNHSLCFLISQKWVDPSYKLPKKVLSLQFIAYNRSVLLNTLHNRLREAFYTVVCDMSLTFDKES